MTVTTEVQQFIVSELLQGRGIDSVDPAENLLAKGIMDSHGVMELVGFLEERYGIAIGDEDRDNEAARGAGIASGAVTFGYNTGATLRAQGPDLVFDDYADLVAKLTS